MNTKNGYGLRVKLNLPYEQAIERVTSALKAEGFGVLTQIDVKKIIKEKLNEDFRKYIILGACNPNLSHQALKSELEIGLLLPCNVIVYEQDGGSVVSILDPVKMIAVAENDELNAVSGQARARLERVIQALQS